ncbi:MAG TPA: hypothetical protein PKD68_00525 [Candidatus Saccharibacteria bacterium]|nr:hypothetical protein [Candidatus Saccharibacteria bacterium]
MSTQLQLDVDDTGVKYTARQWEVIIHPGSEIVDLNDRERVAWGLNPITLTEFRRLYGRKKCGIRHNRELDLTTLAIGQSVEIETLSKHLYTFVYRGTSDGSGLTVIMDSVNRWDGSTLETIACDRWIRIGTGFVFGNKRSSRVVNHACSFPPE